MFVVSLDFELHWGVRDLLRVHDYRANLLGVRQAIPALLELFSEFGIRATWATVGFLFFETIDELLDSLPAELPRYLDKNLDPYPALSEVGHNESEDPFHFAPTLIRMIQATPGQEIGTHTFSHFYTGAPGPTLESFRADIRAARCAGRRLGVEIKSIAFPRNQISLPHLRICSEEGLIAYRGVELDAGTGAISRAKRLVDNYVRLSGRRLGSPAKQGELEIANVPQSRFLRPYNTHFRILEPLRLRRLLSSMTFAAKNRQLCHLWWHPHNFGSNVRLNISFLREVLTHYRRLREQFGFQSLTMAEAAETVLAQGRAECLVS